MLERRRKRFPGPWEKSSLWVPARGLARTQSEPMKVPRWDDVVRAALALCSLVSPWFTRLFRRLVAKPIPRFATFPSDQLS